MLTIFYRIDDTGDRLLTPRNTPGRAKLFVKSKPALQTEKDNSNNLGCDRVRPGSDGE
jgi:hypothetical protein